MSCWVATASMAIAALLRPATVVDRMSGSRGTTTAASSKPSVGAAARSA
jgi:hypothetical protein